MKKRIVVFLIICLLPLFAFSAGAKEADAAEDYYVQAFAGIDADTRRLLESIGVSGADLYAVSSVSPESLLSLLRELFGTAFTEKAKLLGECLALMLLIRFFASFISSPAVLEAVEQAGNMMLVFLLVSGAAAAGDACVQAVRLTKNCIVTLIPVLGVVLTFSGNPASALSVHAAVFSFAQGVGVLFADLAVPLTSLGAALGSAAAICPVPGLEQLSVLVRNAVTWGMALVSGVFAAVLGIRGAVSGAADGVAAKGIRFLLGGVPVVGGALGEALSALNGSLALVKNSVAVLGVLAVLLISLPGVCSLLVWKGMLYVIGAAAQMLSFKKAPAFIAVLQSVFSVLLAVILFNAFVYVVALAVVVSVKAMG